MIRDRYNANDVFMISSFEIDYANTILYIRKNIYTFSIIERKIKKSCSKDISRCERIRVENEEED